MGDIGSAQCGDIYVNEDEAIYRVISTASHVDLVTVQRIDGPDDVRLDHLSGPVGSGAWAGFRRIFRPVEAVASKDDSYRYVGTHLECPVYVESGCWRDHTYAIGELERMLREQAEHIDAAE